MNSTLTFCFSLLTQRLCFRGRLCHWHWGDSYRITTSSTLCQTVDYTLTHSLSLTHSLPADDSHLSSRSNSHALYMHTQRPSLIHSSADTFILNLICLCTYIYIYIYICLCILMALLINLMYLYIPK